MAGLRQNIYFSNKLVIEEIKKQDKVSRYVEDCVLFYMENHDIVRKYIDTVSNISNLIDNK